jgi:hypothetical protein
MKSRSFLVFLLAIPLVLSIESATLSADCIEVAQGRVVTVEVQACEAINAEKNKEVQKYAGPYYETWNLKKAYTGALIKDSGGSFWMYSSENKNPCAEFPKKKVIEKKAYSTCCDTGRWGKCVFGGRFLGDLDAKPINAFQ